MSLSIKELIFALEQKEKAVFLYNTTQNALPLLAVCDQLESYIGKMISNQIITEINMENLGPDNFNNYIEDNYDPSNDEDDYYDNEDDEAEEDYDDELYDESEDSDDDFYEEFYDEDDDLEDDDIDSFQMEEIDDEDYGDEGYNL